MFVLISTSSLVEIFAAKSSIFKDSFDIIFRAIVCQSDGFRNIGGGNGIFVSGIAKMEFVFGIADDLSLVCWILGFNCLFSISMSLNKFLFRSLLSDDENEEDEGVWIRMEDSSSLRRLFLLEIFPVVGQRVGNDGGGRVWRPRESALGGSELRPRLCNLL